MRTSTWLAAAMAIPLASGIQGGTEGRPAPGGARDVELPAPSWEVKVPLERALRERRSVREFVEAPLSLAEISQLCWAAQGITSPEGGRTAPSAGALYPLELYVLAGGVEGLAQGVHRYDPPGHGLIEVAAGDRRKELCQAALGQDWMGAAPAVLVIAAVYARTAVKYGERAERYVHIEAGHAAQNVCLGAAASGLGTTVVGAFDEDRVRRVLGLRQDEQPLVLLPVGRRR